MPGRLPGQSVRLGRVHVLAEDLVDVPEELGQAENKMNGWDKKLAFVFERIRTQDSRSTLILDLLCCN